VSETSTETETAPGELELVRAFVNTRELDPDREEIGDPDALAEWIRGHEIPLTRTLDGRDVERAMAFREAVRALLLANAGAELRQEAVSELRAAAAAAPLRVEVEPDGSLETVPAAAGVDGLVARVFAAIAAGQESGEWKRLRACTSDECLWAFYDRSRNRSRHWCSMEVCGNRAKTRAYRAKGGPRKRSG
jgi:predicted RNA-binding Zn ribbon-like protein